MNDNLILKSSPGLEKSVLSWILKEPVSFLPRAKAEGITGDHFNDPARRSLFEALLALPAADIELVSLIDRLGNSGDLEALGGPAAITEIYTFSASPQHWDRHAAKLKNLLAIRRVQLSAVKALEAAEEAGEGDAESLISMLEKSAEDAGRVLHGKDQLVSAKAAADGLLRRMMEAANGAGELPGLGTGMPPVDYVTGGMRPGQLWITAGETSAGKSVMLLQMVNAVLAAGGAALVISLEMEAVENLARLACCRSGVPLGVFMDPRHAKKHDLQRADRALKELAGASLAIDEQGGRTMEQIEGLAATFKARTAGKLDLLVIDYVQLVEATRRYKNDTQATEIGEAVKAMKNLAKRLGCTVASASQLNDDGKLFGSRAIGHHADVVLRIQDDGVKGMKVRSGRKGQLFPLVLNGELQRFEERRPA